MCRFSTRVVTSSTAARTPCLTPPTAARALTATLGRPQVRSCDHRWESRSWQWKLAVIDSVDIHKHGILFGQYLFCLVSYPMLPTFLRSFCRHAAIDAELEQNEGRSRWKQPTTFFKSSLWTQSGCWLIYVGLCILDHVVGSCILYFGSNLPLSSNPAYGLSQVGWTAVIMKPIMCFVPFCWQLSF